MKKKAGKKGYQETSRYLMAAEQERREKDEFIENHGQFFFNVIASQMEQREKYRYIMKSFEMAATQLPKMVMHNKPSEETSAIEPYEWAGISEYSNDSMVHGYDIQDVVPFYAAIANGTFAHVILGSSENVFVDFDTRRLLWHDEWFNLTDCVVSIGFTGDEAEGLVKHFDFTSNDRIKASVCLCNNTNGAVGFMRAIEEGKVHYVGLSHFSMLFLLDESRRAELEARQRYLIEQREKFRHDYDLDAIKQEVANSLEPQNITEGESHNTSGNGNIGVPATEDTSRQTEGNKEPENIIDEDDELIDIDVYWENGKVGMYVLYTSHLLNGARSSNDNNVYFVTTY